MKDDSIIYVIANSVAYLIIYILCLVIVINAINNVFARLFLGVVFFLACGYLEEKLLSRYVNELIEKILNLIK